MTRNNLKAIDFFCSGGGMTYGLRLAGVDVIAGIDNDPSVQETYERNNPDSKFILADIFKFNEKDLREKTGIKQNDDDLIFIGCSPCQYWSIIHTDRTKSEITKDLLKEFHRFVKFFRPGFVVIENVPGLQRQSTESGLQEFIDDLKKHGYIVSYDIYNLNNYGVPQSRKRFSLIASRVVPKKILPKVSPNRLVVRDVLGEANGFPRVEAGHRDSTSFQHTVSRLSEENLLAIRATPKNGGNTIKRRISYKGSGFRDSYGRMSWDKPAPTITTNFHKLSSGRFGHPEEDRAISLREGASLQTFPKEYIFYANSISAIAKMIGNAVPPEFAKRIALAIIESLEDYEE